LILSAKQRRTITGAALLTLFVSAMDALIVSAAMPTVVADLGGLHLFSWVYTVFFLARTISLPIIGKLADLYSRRTLLLSSVAVFTLASLGAGCAWNMPTLIAARVLQGISSGGVMALVYIVLADVTEPAGRGRALSLASSVWGIASVLGPTLGGVLVTYLSWRWIFWVNIPLGLLSLWGIGAYFIDTRPKVERVALDGWGAVSLTVAILAFLIAFLLGGRRYAWFSPQIIGLLALFLVSAVVFFRIEKSAAAPILSTAFFPVRGFAAGNGAVFFSSFAIFALFAYAPLYIQTVQSRSPMQVGLAMLSLSLAWSIGSIALGMFIHRLNQRPAGVVGAAILLAGCAMTLTFTAQSSFFYGFSCFFIVGLGMGFVALSTMLVVQSSLPPADLGVATSSNQFARTLGGTVGVGVCGGFFASRLAGLTETIRASGVIDRLPANLAESGLGDIESLLHPDVLAEMPPELTALLVQGVAQGTDRVFWGVTLSAAACLVLCWLVPGRKSEPL